MRSRLFRFKAGPSDARRIYDTMIANLGDQYSTEVGSRQEATCFAQALGIAREDKRLRDAANERLATKANETLPSREAAYGLIPGPNDTMADRHAALAARVKLPQQWSAVAIRAALTALLGTDFIAYRPTPQSDAVMYPATIGAWPMNLQRPSVARKVLELKTPVAFVGTPITVPAIVTGPTGAPINPGTQGPVAGDVFVFDAGMSGIADAVTVTAVTLSFSEFSLVPTYNVTGTFTQPHDAGALGVTQPFPYWVSTKRHSLVVVSAAAAADPERRRKVDEAMRRMVTARSTWDIVAGTSSATTAFQLGQPSLSQRTLSTVSLP